MLEHKRPKKDNYFCYYPFYHLATTPNGNYRLCCVAYDETINHKDMNYEQWWASDHLNEIRSKLIKGEKHQACENCYKIEKTGGLSKRLEVQRMVDIDSIDFQNPSIKSIDFRMSNLCNAMCATCVPKYSSLIDQEYNRIFSDREKYSFINLKNYIQKANNHDFSSVPKELFSNLESIYLSGGEPSISQDVLTLLKKLKSNCHIIFNTNLKIINNEFWHELKRFEEFSIGPSFDGTEDAFNFLRYPIKYQSFIENVNWVIDNFPNAYIFLNFTYSILNYNQIENVFKIAVNLKLKHQRIELKFNILHRPDFLNINNLSIEEREPLAQNLLKFIQTNEMDLKSLEAINSITTLYNYLAESKENPLASQNKLRTKSFIEAISKSRNMVFSHLNLT